MTRAVTLWAGAVLWVLSTSEPAEANVEAQSGYTKVQTYNAALRYLRVDLSYEVTEKDAEAAYLLFKFLPEGRKKETNGAIEIVERQEGVRVYVRLPELPRYQEEVLSEGLFRKLRNEYGDPPRHEDPPAKEPKAPKEPNDKEKKQKGPEAPGND